MYVDLFKLDHITKKTGLLGLLVSGLKELTEKENNKPLNDQNTQEENLK